MTKINFTGDAPVYFPVSFQGPSGIVYGLNVFPGEQDVEDGAWAELQNHPESMRHIGAGVLSLVSSPALPEADEAPEGIAPEVPEGEATGLHEGVGGEPEAPKGTAPEGEPEPEADEE